MLVSNGWVKSDDPIPEISAIQIETKHKINRIKTNKTLAIINIIASFTFHLINKNSTKTVSYVWQANTWKGEWTPIVTCRPKRPALDEFVFVRARHREKSHNLNPFLFLHVRRRWRQQHLFKKRVYTFPFNKKIKITQRPWTEPNRWVMWTTYWHTCPRYLSFFPPIFHFLLYQMKFTHIERVTAIGRENGTNFLDSLSSKRNYAWERRGNYF